MFCVRCGRQNPDDANVCSYCGYRFSNRQKNDVYPKKNSNYTTGIIIGILTGLVIAALGVIVWNCITPDESTPEPSDKIIEKYAEQNTSKTKKEDISVKKTEVKKEIVSEPVSPGITKKNAYLETARSIEEYSSLYLETAENQHDMNSESAIVFEKWDTLLNDVYSYLKVTLPSGEFTALEESEINWIIEKEAAIELEGSKWAGGSMEPLARNSTAITYTKDRCYYLISLIN